MISGTGGSSFSGQTITNTVAAVSKSMPLPEYATILLLRAPSTNAGSVYARIGSLAATTGDTEIRKGENVVLDLSQLLHLKMVHLGRMLQPNDFPRFIQYIGTANDTLLVDAFTMV